MRHTTWIILAAVLVLGTGALAKTTETVIYELYPDGGAGPEAPVVFDRHGNLYGTASYGGVNGDGAVFELTPSGSGWTPTILHTFTGGSDGANLYGPVVLDKHGNVFGTTYQGGNPGDGTVFELQYSRGVWSKTVLYNFCSSSGCADGAYPESGLVLDAEGNLYGTTQGGGATNRGVVFELTPSGGGAWAETVLYSFSGANDGKYPTADVTLDSAGNIYGTTPIGTANYGTVYELTPSESGWTETTLHTFFGGNDGATPSGPVVLDASGDVYGTTLSGGYDNENCPNGCGTVFKLHAANKWNENVLYRFKARNDGLGPIGGVVLDKYGDIYGAASGGKDEIGTVFILTNSILGWTIHPVPLTNYNAEYPYAGVTLHGGNIYGTAYGEGGLGAVFLLTF
jgi:uncharacterized repeat protein (TIGR03803 family)